MHQLPWSIQNIVQRSYLHIYQQIFAFLLQIYRVKYLLQSVRPTRSQRTNRAQSQVLYRLQHRLTWFTDILRSYLTENVIFFTTQDMVAAMEKAEDIDEMSQIHIACVAKLQERALVTKDLKPIQRAILEILDLGVLFAEAACERYGHSKAKTGLSAKARSTSTKRRSTALFESIGSSDSEEVERGDGVDGTVTSRTPAQQDPAETLRIIDSQFSKLLVFVRAGLRSVGRVGAEPMWEQLAERLEWEGKKDRI